MGDVKPWFMGEKPMCCHLSCFTNLFNGLVLLWGGSYGWGLRQLLPLGVGWQDCQSLSHMPTPPTTTFTLLSHVSNFEDYGLLLSRLVFNLQDGGLLVPPLEGLLIRALR